MDVETGSGMVDERRRDRGEKGPGSVMVRTCECGCGSC